MDDTIRAKRIHAAGFIAERLTNRFGARYTEYRGKWEAACRLDYESDYPLHIDMDTMDACNLSCTYCTEEHGFIRKRTMGKLVEGVVDGLFAEASAYKGRDRLCAVNVGTLGEPFLQPEKVFRILEHSSRAGVMETFVHTNGHLLTLEIFKKLVERGLTHLFFSLDALREDTYLKMRGKPLGSVLRNILDVVEYKRANGLDFPALRVSFLLSDENRAERQDFIEFWTDKVDIIDVQNLTDFTRPVDLSRKPSLRCSDPFKRMYVGVDGQMAPCCAGYAMLPAFQLGRFPEMSLAEAWNGEAVRTLRQAHLGKDFERQPICRECLLRSEGARG